MFNSELELRNEALSRINEKLAMAVETARVFTACKNLDELYHKVLEEFAKNLCAQGGSLFLIHPDRLERIHTLDPQHVPEDIPFPLPEKSVFRQVIEWKRPILIKDIDECPDMSSSGWHGYRNSSALVIPLLDRDDVLRGLISLHDKQDPPFAQHDQGFALLLSSFASEVLRSLQALQSLHNSRERFRTVIEATHDAMILLSESGQIQMFNKAAEGIFGYKEDELLGLSMGSLLPEEHLPEFENLVETCLDAFGPESIPSKAVEMEALRRDGSPFPTEISISQGQCGDERFILIVLRDISRKR